MTSQREFWQPLILEIAQKKLELPIIVGINGPIGIGKTTVSGLFVEMFAELGLKAVAFSLDDLYKSYEQRRLMQKEDPRLVWRGPPGTHDIGLGLELFRQVLSGQKNIALWRFDKSLEQGRGDRKSKPEIASHIDILLFEGWFVGYRPIDFSKLDFLPDLIKDEQDYAFAQDCNERLRDYLPLWEKLSSLIVLNPQDYHYSLQWRQDAEKKQAIGMSEAEIEDFVVYFWKALHPELYLTELIEDCDNTDFVVDIDYEHQPTGIYRPQRTS